MNYHAESPSSIGWIADHLPTSLDRSLFLLPARPMPDQQRLANTPVRFTT